MKRYNEFKDEHRNIIARITPAVRHCKNSRVTDEYYQQMAGLHVRPCISMDNSKKLYKSERFSNVKNLHSL